MANGNGNKKYSDEVKAKVMAGLLAGNAAPYLAKKYNVKIHTIYSWKYKIDGMTSQAGLKDLNTKKAEQIAELLWETCVEHFKAQIAICRQFQDSAWLNKQAADNLALSDGILNDKGIRILEASEPDQEIPEGDPILNIQRAG
jgi:transposase-like protein